MDRIIEAGIYAIVNKANNKMYIGQSINLDARKSEHFGALKRNKHYNDHLQKSFNKYGESAFDFIVIERCDIALLNEMESEYIKKFNTMNKNAGYNLRSGGGVNYLSEVSKKKISETRKERIASGQIIMKAVTHTEQRSRRMSESLKRYFSDKEARISLSKARTTISLELVKEIKTMLRFTDLSIIEISKRLNVSALIIGHVCRLNSHEYICEEYNPFLLNRHDNIEKKNTRKVMRLYREGKTYKEISTELGIHLRTAIRIVERNKNKHDERCRDNVLLWRMNKQLSLIKTLFNMGNNKVEVSKKLKVGRGIVTKYLNGTLDASASVGRYNPFNYRAAGHS